MSALPSKPGAPMGQAETLLCEALHPWCHTGHRQSFANGEQMCGEAPSHPLFQFSSVARHEVLETQITELSPGTN